MGNIVLLDDLTINQIAAGEVIERPASVVKELVENSIDAGATNITVEIKNGGISYIRITDNGKGIMPDDMEIAFERHATSKIRKAEDLEMVKCMGFRGEALPSTAAIANVEMCSKTDGDSVGYKIVIEGGNILYKDEYGCPKGTTITVKNLFYNTPVRYKFLKKDFTEFGYIEDAITRIALINPNISIKLINSGKTVIQTPGNNDIKTVIYNIYGKDISENIMPVNYTYEDINVTGIIGKPAIARSNRSNQLFFVNKRFIKDKVLSSAAEQAYKGLIGIGKHGFLILNLDVDMHKVDVNVHPAKLEVRFEEENKIFKAVYHAIKETLLKEKLIKSSTENETSSFIIDKKVLEKINFNEQLESNHEKNILTQYKEEQKNASEMDNGVHHEKQNEPEENKTDLKEENGSQNFEEMYTKMFGYSQKEDKKNEIQNKLKEEAEEYHFEEANSENISLFSNTNKKNIPNYKIIGIAFNQYIIVEIEKEMYIISEISAHQRLIYEEIKKNYYNKGERDSQLMLLPDILTLTNKEMAILKDNFEIFKKVGFTLEEFGENTIKISGVPSVCIDLDIKKIFVETLEEINTVARTAKSEIEEKLISTLSNQVAKREKLGITKGEIDNLLEELLELENPFTDSYGNTLAMRMSKAEIEKKFSRRK